MKCVLGLPLSLIYCLASSRSAGAKPSISTFLCSSAVNRLIESLYSIYCEFKSSAFSCSVRNIQRRKIMLVTKQRA